MILSSVWFGGFLRESGLPLGVPAGLAGVGVALVGILMVSPIPYRSFKDIRLPRSYGTVVLMVIAFAVILSKPSVTFFLVGLIYVVSGPVELLRRWRTGESLEEIVGESGAPPETRGTMP
jgi:phosphatidylserine synthase